jgi:probable phosphoglycerate mutase
MTQLLLIRHATNDYVRTGRLAGWTPEVHLNEKGRAQAAALGERLASARLTAVYSSPLERTVETAQAVAEPHDLKVQLREDLGEIHYGEWTGKKLKKLRRTRLWQVIQHYPSGARFPGGESIRETQARVVGALERIAEQHPKGRVAVVAHSDVLKLTVAHFAGMPLDMYQRLIIDPASLSVVWLGKMGPRIAMMNDTSHHPRDEEKKRTRQH